MVLRHRLSYIGLPTALVDGGFYGGGSRHRLQQGILSQLLTPGTPPSKRTDLTSCLPMQLTRRCHVLH